MPTGSSASSAAARWNASAASSRPTPNLLAASPVARYSWPPPATPGFSRTEIGAVRPADRAAAATSSSSSSDSILIERMPKSTAVRISSSRLPTPEKTMFAGAMPAFRALMSSPPETTSAPRSAAATTSSSASASLALTA
jgi:hypothetical protein